MKLSKKKRAVLAEKSREQELRNIEQTAFWDKMRIYLDNAKDTPQTDEAFDRMVSYFAKVYNARKLTASLKEYPSLPQLTQEVFSEWVSVSDAETRQQEVLAWLDSARQQAKCEFIKRHPYKIKLDFDSGRWVDFDRWVFDGRIVDITNGEEFSLDDLSKLEEYNAIHHREVDLKKELERMNYYKYAWRPRTWEEIVIM